MMNIYEELNLIFLQGTEAALCTIVKTDGSAPAPAGTKMLVYNEGKISGTVGGGRLEKRAVEDAKAVIASSQSSLFKYQLVKDLDMCCGGTVQIFIEPVMKQNKLYIFGSGHVGQALAQHASYLDFKITVIDDRKDYLQQIKSDRIHKLGRPFNDALQELHFDKNTFICILTYSHPLDREILAYCLKQPYAYLGMIGSRRKIEVTKRLFLSQTKAAPQELENIDTPIGIDIHARTPNEIAISILARLIQVKNQKEKNQLENANLAIEECLIEK